MKSEATPVYGHEEIESGSTATKSIVLYSRDIDFCVSLRMLFQNRYKIVTITDPDMLMTTVQTFRPHLLIADTMPTERMLQRFGLMKSELPLLRIILFYATSGGNERYVDAAKGFADAAYSKPLDIDEITKRISEFMEDISA